MTSEPIDPQSDMPTHTYGSGQTKQGDIKSLKVAVISTADDNVNIAEPSTPTHSQYPYNSATQTQSGHLRETDDTPGAERILEMHKAGTFYEIHPDGSKVTKIFGDDFYIILKDHTLVVGGNLNITVQGDANFLVKGNMKTKVDGNYNLTVNGDMTTRVKGKTTTYSKDTMTIQSKNDINVRSQNNMKITSNKQFTLRSSSVMQVWSDARIYIDGSRVDLNLPGANPAALVDADPTAGLTVADSVIEPSVDVLMILKTDNNNLASIVDVSTIKFPKDRVNGD